MSGFGWDLPPGVRESDIPGNRPQDVAYQEEFERLMDEEDLSEEEAEAALRDWDPYDDEPDWDSMPGGADWCD